MSREEGVAPPSNDAYTGMLSISLLALLSGCLLLYLDYSQYPDTNPPVSKASPSTPPSKGGPEGAVAKGKEFHIEPEAIEIPSGSEKTVEAKFGKVKAVEVKQPAKGLNFEIQNETSIRFTADPVMEDQVFAVTVTSTEDKHASVVVTVRKEKDKKE